MVRLSKRDRSKKKNDEKLDQSLINDVYLDVCSPTTLFSCMYVILRVSVLVLITKTTPFLMLEQLLMILSAVFPFIRTKILHTHTLQSIKKQSLLFSAMD